MITKVQNERCAEKYHLLLGNIYIYVNDDIDITQIIRHLRNHKEILTFFSISLDKFRVSELNVFFQQSDLSFSLEIPHARACIGRLGKLGSLSSEPRYQRAARQTQVIRRLILVDWILRRAEELLFRTLLS